MAGRRRRRRPPEQEDTVGGRTATLHLLGCTMILVVTPRSTDEPTSGRRGVLSSEPAQFLLARWAGGGAHCAPAACLEEPRAARWGIGLPLPPNAYITAFATYGCGSSAGVAWCVFETMRRDVSCVGCHNLLKYRILVTFINMCRIIRT